MAKPKLTLPEVAAIRALVDGEGRLAVRVTPGARSEGLEIAEGRLLAKVRAKPEDGKATAAVIDLVAQGLGVAASRVTLLRGATSREKLLAVAG
ncbi:DUF167 domain-containing protein [Novosphingobium umbonatum]|uniref:UPF0235 protein EOE18_09700 n=1 Tax=Novosphingobium umbonatum TaxID=1908524 RepID=A0A3S2V6M8_9SPHN|nr:DUF167 domain-containing protein [Novosphingobium umbonatum]RVU05003.1 DUF167 domain-containing protein [Novosphingobium umbonatum]